MSPVIEEETEAGSGLPHAGPSRSLERWPWRTSIQQGLAPVSIGLLLAGCFTMAKGAIFGVETAAIAVGVLLILLQYKINPALLVLGGAVLGVISFMPK
jgi:chromate transporter